MHKNLILKTLILKNTKYVIFILKNKKVMVDQKLKIRRKSRINEVC